MSTPSDLITSGINNALSQIISIVWPLFAVALLMKMFKAFFRRPQVKGWVGEKTVSTFSLKGLDLFVYTLFEDLYLPRPDGKGTTQIDHVIVSPYGVFVVETKNMDGSIFGREEGSRWTQVVRGKKASFQNPLRQNRLHVKTLMKFLGLQEGFFHSVVYFAGESTFKTPMPSNVIDKGLKRYIAQYGAVLLNSRQVEAAVRRLKEVVETGRSGDVRREHVRNLQRLHGGRRRKAALSLKDHPTC